MTPELWVIEDTNYRLPVYCVNDGQDVFACEPAPVNFLQKQLVLLCSRLESKMLSRNGGTFYLNKSALLSIARKVCLVGQQDPEDILMWTAKGGNGKYETDNEDEFYTSFINRCAVPGIRTPQQVKLLFFWFNLHTMHWLLNKQRPVDLYFAKLHPFPFRSDWKNVIFKKDASLPPLFVRGRKIKFARFIPDMFRRLGEYFFCDEILGVNDQAEGITWTLDVELQEPWEEHARKLEAVRIEARQGKYWHGVMENMKRRSIDAMRLYAKWLGEIRRKKPSVPVCWDDVSCEFLEQRRVRIESARPSALSSIADHGEASPSTPEGLGAEDYSMLPLPNFQSPMENVRDVGKKPL